MSTRVLFVCIHNSARSQMAEELLRKYGNGLFETESAGIEPGKLNPFVVQVLKEEEAIDITGKATQSVAQILESGKQYDYVVTVCDETSAERCPVFPGDVKRLHWGFEDPSSVAGGDEEKLAVARQVKAQIKTKIEEWVGVIARK